MNNNSIKNNRYSIEIKNIYKSFKCFDNPVTGPIKNYLFGKVLSKKNFNEFIAINNLSMKVKKGEVIGIIGPNGSGKTTLLKIIANLLQADKGEVNINGKVTALLASGAGIHPEFTGRENILFNGLTIGLKKEEILNKIDDIINFAEIGSFIDQPFRTYSSGMQARLLFSVTMYVKSEILIIDEALSTGDAYFVEKSKDKIKEFCNSGSTILMVSHNIHQISELCNRAYLITNGRINCKGNTDYVIKQYNEWNFKRKGVVKKIKSNFSSLSGDESIILTKVQTLNKKSEETVIFKSGEELRIKIFYENLKFKKKVRLWVGFIDMKSQICFSEIGRNKESVYSNGHIFKPDKNGSIYFKFSPLYLQYSKISLWIIFTSLDGSKIYSEYKNVSPIEISGRYQSISYASYKFWHPYKIIND